MKQGVADHLTRVSRVNQESKANGALMRQTPLIVWVRKLPVTSRIQYISTDTRLSHPNQTCVDSSIAYMLAVTSLLNHQQDVARAIEVAEEWATKHAVQEVKQWICDDSSVLTLDQIDPTRYIGFVKWGIILSFYHLRQESDYVKGIEETLSLGGDTDTNAAIVGGMLGTLHGLHGIPEQMLDKVKNYRFKDGDKFGYPRPDFLDQQQINQLVTKLITNSVL